jgi:hypothetical protein
MLKKTGMGGKDFKNSACFGEKSSDTPSVFLKPANPMVLPSYLILVSLVDYSKTEPDDPQASYKT